MSKRHHVSKPATKHTRAERAHMRAVKRRSGPSGVRRRERRAHLQPCAECGKRLGHLAECSKAPKAEAMAELADHQPERVKTMLDEYAPIED